MITCPLCHKEFKPLLADFICHTCELDIVTDYSAKHGKGTMTPNECRKANLRDSMGSGYFLPYPYENILVAVILAILVGASFANLHNTQSLRDEVHTLQAQYNDIDARLDTLEDKND